MAGSWASQWVVPVAARLRSRSEAAVTLQRLMRLGGAEGDFAADAAVHVLATAVSHVEACAIQCPRGHRAVFFAIELTPGRPLIAHCRCHAPALLFCPFWRALDQLVAIALAPRPSRTPCHAR